MNRRSFVSLCIAAAPLCRADAGFKSLLNGRDLDGWTADTDGIWSVRDGMIIGKTAGLKFNDFLRTKDSYSNFVLKSTFRLINNVGNSGIQFRSKTVPNSHEVSGYQADIGQTHWGSLYDESRRRITLVQPSEKQLAGVDKSGWNIYTITAIGNHIKVDLNNIPTVDYTEKDSNIDNSGFIALQVHMKFAMEVQFKEILIKQL